MLIKKFLGVFFLLTIFVFPQNVSAEKTDWYDKNFNFHNISKVLVFDLTANRDLDDREPVLWRNMQDIFNESTNKLKCTIVTEAEARRLVGEQLGMDLESMSYSDPAEVRRIIMHNAYDIADAWVVANLDHLDVGSYVIPAHTDWESKKETRKYYDRHGKKHEETYTVQVPVTRPERRVSTLKVQLTMQAFESRRGGMIFARKDIRNRDDYSGTGMYNRICESFFDDLRKKIR